MTGVDNPMIVEEWLGKDNQLGIDIWNKKYRRNNETFDEWLDRVSINNQYIKNLILQKKFIPAGRILSNRGIDGEKCSLSNCYVITPPEDSIESIYETCSKLARTYSYGGGCGIDISNLAPEGAKVHNQAKATSGAVSFMDTFSQVTEQIGQNGRRGALMISISDTHPDLEKFITVKSDLNKVNYANISVRISDAFMKAVEEDKDWELKFERKETGEVISKTVKAKELFRKLCEQNWNYAEPGMLFWDRINNYNLLSNTKSFKYAGVNPCAEEPLPAGGSCNLCAINLAAFVKDARFDFDDFSYVVQEAVKYQNDILTEGLTRHPLKEQQESVANYKQIGIGIMGLADMLIKLHIRYGSEEALELCDKIGTYLNYYGIKASSDLGDILGQYKDFNLTEVTTTEYWYKQVESFSKYNLTMFPFIHLRNSQLFTIAPTGTISTMIGVSGGIEPIFANYYERTTKSLHGKDVKYKVYTPIVKQYMDAHNIEDDNNLPQYFVTSSDIPVYSRINMQAVWQKHIDASISSTVNLPNEATIEDVENLYMYAWKSGLKGITVYRAGCAREGILVAKDTKADKEEDNKRILPKELPRGFIYQTRDNDMIGIKRTLTTGCGKLHMSTYWDDATGELLEVFLDRGRDGGCNSFMIGLSRMISLAARGGVAFLAIVDQLTSTYTCPSYNARKITKGDVSPGNCCPTAIGKALIDVHKQVCNMIGIDDEEADVNTNNKTISTKAKIVSEKCPECGADIVHENGCNSCKSCGYSKCG